MLSIIAELSLSESRKMEYIYLTGTDNNESSRNVKNAMT